MAIRNWDTGFWSDPDFDGAGAVPRLLYFYLATNPHANAAGLYPLTARKMAFECDLTVPEVERALEVLVERGKIQWDAAASVVWVLGFARRNIQSPKLLRPALAGVRSVGAQWAVRWLEHNREHLARWTGVVSELCAEMRIPYHGSGQNVDTLSENPDTLSSRARGRGPGRAGDQDRTDQDRTGQEGEARGRAPDPPPPSASPPAGQPDNRPDTDDLPWNLEREVADSWRYSAIPDVPTQRAREAFDHLCSKFDPAAVPKWGAAGRYILRGVHLLLHHGEDAAAVLRLRIDYAASPDYSRRRDRDCPPNPLLEFGRLFGSEGKPEAALRWDAEAAAWAAKRGGGGNTTPRQPWWEREGMPIEDLSDEALVAARHPLAEAELERRRLREAAA